MKEFVLLSYIICRRIKRIEVEKENRLRITLSMSHQVRTKFYSIPPSITTETDRSSKRNNSLESKSTRASPTILFWDYYLLDGGSI